MKLLDSIRELLGKKLEQRSLTVESVFGAFQPGVMVPAPAGVDVNGTTAMSISAVWNAVNLIAGSGVASIPLKVFKETEKGREDASSHYLYRLVHDEPNKYMTSFTFRETLMHHVLLWGNAYAEIEWDRSGRPVALWPLSPIEMQVTVENGEPVYRYKGQKLDSTDLIHVPGLGFDGIKGYSVISMARQSFGLAIATERYGGSFFGNGAWPGLVATYPNALSPAARKNLTDSLNSLHRGPDRAHSTMILEEGATVTKVGIPPEDAQFLETRNFSVVEVARWFNIPPHKIKDMGRATWGNAEQMNVQFVVDCLRPWYVKLEQEFNRKLVSKEQRGVICIEFIPEGLLRGDIATRYASYATGRQWGFLSVNEIRKFENMNPLPAEIGDQYLAPANMVPADQLGAEPDPAPAPAADAPPDQAGAVRASIRAIVVEAAYRMARKEANEARRAAKSPEKLQAWAERFYVDHVEQLVEAVGPSLRALYQSSGVAEPNLQAVFGAISRRHAEAILTLPASSRQEQEVEKLVSGWEVHLPVEISDLAGGRCDVRAETKSSASPSNISLTVNVPPGSTVIENRMESAPSPVIHVAPAHVTVSPSQINVTPEIRAVMPAIQNVRIIGSVDTETKITAVPKPPDTLTSVLSRDSEGRPTKVLHESKG